MALGHLIGYLSAQGALLFLSEFIVDFTISLGCIIVFAALFLLACGGELGAATAAERQPGSDTQCQYSDITFHRHYTL